MSEDRNADSPLQIQREGDELVIRLGTNRLDGNDRHPSLPTLTFEDRDVWIQDVIRELKADEEDGSTPLTDVFDQCMSNAIDNGSIGIAGDSDVVVGHCYGCGEDQVALNYSRGPLRCSSCRTKSTD